tara:strand:+ start:1487 stop:1711 length:225 start_codon:yes stop_codon:yes gene_type:complete
MTFMKNEKRTNNVQFQMFGIKDPDGLICPRITHSALGAWENFIGACYGTDIATLVAEHEEDGYKCVKLDVTESN